MSDLDRFLKLGADAKISDAMGALKDTGASMMKIVIRDRDDKPLGAAIFVRGRAETTDIIDACDRIESTWDD